MKNISIIGGGLVGTLLSAILAQKQHKVTVYERRPDLRGEVATGGRSINLAVSDRGFKALRRIGLEETVKKMAIPMRGRMLHAETGQLTFQPYGKEGQAINSVSRGGLNQVLIDFAERQCGVKFVFNHACTQVDFDAKQFTIFNNSTQRASHVDYELLFAADGAFSAVRYAMQKTDRFEYVQTYLLHGYKELAIVPRNGTWQMEPNALHIWPRKSFMLIALPNVDGSFTGTLFLPFEGENSFEMLQTQASVETFFNRYFPDVIPLVPDLTEIFFQNPTSSLITVRCFPWTYKGVTLIGDAAHAVVPFYGQGMNCGFEDCTVLADIMEAYNNDWDVMLNRYEISRKSNADAIAELAQKNFIEMRDRVADPVFLLQKKIAQKVSENYPERYLPVYSMVTFSHIPYSDALMEDKRQDNALSEILALPDIENKWESTYMEQIVGKLEVKGLNKYLSGRRFFKIVSYSSHEYIETIRLRNNVLRIPLGLKLTDSDIASETEHIHIACYDNGELVGCLVLVPQNDRRIKMRQVAVAEDHQGQGIGRDLVLFSENYARQNGFSTMYCHARKNVVSFYEKLGYFTVGDEFIEVTIPHFVMEKSLLGDFYPQS